MGLCNDDDYPGITNGSYKHLRTVMDLNDQGKDVVHEAKVLHYRWSSIHVISVNGETVVPRKKWRGKVINVSVGRDSNGLIGTNSFVYSSDGAVTFYGCVDVLNGGSTLDLGSLRSWPR